MPEKSDLSGRSSEELVLMLYDGAIRFMDQAKEKIGDAEARHNLLIRAQNVVLELLYALDRKSGGAVAENLAGLYTYTYQRLVEANVMGDAEKITEAREIIAKLREAWASAVKRLNEAKEGT